MRDPQGTRTARPASGRRGTALVELAATYGSRFISSPSGISRTRKTRKKSCRTSCTGVRNVGTFRGDAALSSWIYRITFNAAMSRVAHGPVSARAGRRAGRWRSADATTPSARRATRSADWSNLADEGVLRSQLRRRVLRAILALPAIYRAPVVLRDIQGLSTEEASAMLRVKDQTLKSRLHRGRLILRKQLADFAGGLSLHRPIYGT